MRVFVDLLIRMCNDVLLLKLFYSCLRAYLGPAVVRLTKVSNIEPGQCLDGLSLQNTLCCKLE